jgi:hypothetical protein
MEWTMVLGYGRWLNRGGVPEYVGVTKLRCTSEDLWGRYPRLVETPFVRQILVDCPVDFRRLAADPEDVSFLDPGFREGMSMPLFLCFRALGYALARDDNGAKLREAFPPRVRT